MRYSLRMLYLLMVSIGFTISVKPALSGSLVDIFFTFICVLLGLAGSIALSRSL